MKRGRIGPIVTSGVCPTCGKQRWFSRADAKKAARRWRDPKLSAYRCGDYWHYGHLPQAVKAGHLSREQVFTKGTK